MKNSHTGIRLILLLIGIGLLAPVTRAQNFTIMPAPFQTALDNSGKIINNACVWTYLAGTTTAAITYSDNAGTQNSNPIRADSAGRFTAYLLSGSSYKFLYESSCTPPAHGTLLRTADNIAGVPASAATVDVTGVAGETISAGQCAYLSDGSGSKTAGQWFRCDPGNAYSSTTPEIGIAPSAIVSSASGTIRLSGSVTGLAALSVGSTYYAGTSGAITSTLPALRRIVGVADTASSLVVMAPLPTTCVTVTSTSTGTLNNFTPGILGPCTVLRMTNATSATISGFVGGSDGQFLRVEAAGAGQVDFTNRDSNSALGNRLQNLASATTSLAPPSLSASGGYAEYIYESSPLGGWRMVLHEQGAFIAYTPTWTGGAPALGNGTLTGRYYLRGKQVTFELKLAFGSTTTLGAGLWSFTLPPLYAADANSLYVFSARASLAAAGPHRVGAAFNDTSTTTFNIVSDNAGAGWGSATPGVWAASDFLAVTGTYFTS